MNYQTTTAAFRIIDTLFQKDVDTTKIVRIELMCLGRIRNIPYKLGNIDLPYFCSFVTILGIRSYLGVSSVQP